MHEKFMQKVSGDSYKSKAGILHGYIRRSIRNAHYPGITEQENAFVQGIVYYSISEPAWHRLDHYESIIYLRKLVFIGPSTGSDRMEACAYVIKPEFSSLLTQTDWTMTNF